MKGPRDDFRVLEEGLFSLRSTPRFVAGSHI
jgi:hypothetical protein